MDQTRSDKILDVVRNIVWMDTADIASLSVGHNGRRPMDCWALRVRPLFLLLTINK